MSFIPATAAEARRHAAVIYRGVFAALTATHRGVTPVPGVGVALSESLGYDAAVLIAHARSAARRAAESADASVLFSGPVDFVGPKD